MCNLRRKVEGGYLIDTAWIPVKFAVKGKFLEIKRPDGTWMNGWEVMDGLHPNDKPREFSWLNERSRDFKKTRKASDI